MHPCTPLLRFIGWALSALLVLVLGALLYGHSGTDPEKLDVLSSYISEYGSSAPHWPWILLAIFAFAALFMLLAIGFLVRMEKSSAVSIGCMCMAAASMGLYFVAYTPVRRVEVPPASSYAFWTPRWFTPQTARSAYDDGMADAYADIHVHAMRLVLAAGLSGIVLVAAGGLHSGAWRSFAWFTIGSTLVMAVLFLMGEWLHGWHGLWQRLGFGLMYAWLWVARWRITAPFSGNVVSTTKVLSRESLGSAPITS